VTFTSFAACWGNTSHTGVSGWAKYWNSKTALRVEVRISRVHQSTYPYHVTSTSD